MTKELNLKVVSEHNMHCAGCENTVKYTLSRLPGVQAVNASHKTQEIELQLGSEEAGLEQVRAELDRIGYQVEVQ